MTLQGTLLLIAFILLVSWGISVLPQPMINFSRIAFNIGIFTMLVWGFIRFGRDAKRLRQELQAHRSEISAGLNHRAYDLKALRAETAEIAQQARRNVNTAQTNHDALTEQIDSIKKGTQEVVTQAAEKLVEVVKETKQSTEIDALQTPQHEAK